MRGGKTLISQMKLKRKKAPLAAFAIRIREIKIFTFVTNDEEKGTRLNLSGDYERGNN